MKILATSWKGTHLTEACRDSHNWQLALGHSAAWNKTQGKCCLLKLCWKSYVLVGNKKPLRPWSQVEMHNSSLEKESHFPKQGVKFSCWFSWPFKWHLQWHHQTAIRKSSRFFVLFLNHGGSLECLLSDSPRNSDSKSGLLFDALDTPSPFDKGGGGWPNMSISSKPRWWNHHISELAESLDPKKWWWFHPRYATKFRGFFPNSKEQKSREFSPPKPSKKYLHSNPYFYSNSHSYSQDCPCIS